MTVNEAKALNEKVVALAKEFPELHLTAKVTFTKDPFVKDGHNAYITITGPVSSDEEREFCTKNDLPFAQYVDGVLDDSRGFLEFEHDHSLTAQEVDDLVSEYYNARTDLDRYTWFRKIEDTVKKYFHREDRPDNFFKLINIIVLG